MRSLFCFANGISSGANIVLAQFVRDLRSVGQHVDVFVWGSSRHEGWGGSDLDEASGSLEEVLSRDYDFVFCANAFLIPLVVPHLKRARPVLICQGHESYYYGRTYSEVMSEVPLLLELLKLPIHVIATSVSIRQTLLTAAGIDSWYVPVGISGRNFFSRPTVDWDATPKRIAMVGSYLFPLKGIQDGLDALQLLHGELDVVAVLITQEKRGRSLLRRYSFPVELHCRVDQPSMAELYASCHAYLCASWYEGLGLPALEAMACGVPVVSTRHSGAAEYGIDRDNLLFAQPHDVSDLAAKLKELLCDAALARQLTARAKQTVKAFTDVDALPSLLKFQDYAISTALPAPSAESMDTLLRKLEAEGLFTPLSTQQHFRDISVELDQICHQLVNAKLGMQDALPMIEDLKKRIASYLVLPNSEYFSSFKSRHDLCRMLSASNDEMELQSLARGVLRAISQ